MYLRGLEMQRAQERMGTRGVQVGVHRIDHVSSVSSTVSDERRTCGLQAELQRREKAHEWLINSKRARAVQQPAAGLVC